MGLVFIRVSKELVGDDRGRYLGFDLLKGIVSEFRNGVYVVEIWSIRCIISVFVGYLCVVVS